MFTNYLKLALRNLLRNRSHAIINIVGLSVGITACLLIAILIRFETSFDNFHTKKDRIYRMVSDLRSPDGVRYTAGIPFPVADALRKEFAGVENAAAIYGVEEVQISIPDGIGSEMKKFKEDVGVFYAEPQFFQLFDFRVLTGDPTTALADPRRAVVTRATAVRYFGDWKSAVGKTLIFKNRDSYTVAAVLDDVPVNSDFPLQVVLPYKAFRSQNEERFADWVSTYGHNYCFTLLRPDVSPKEFEKFLAEFVNRHKPPQYRNEQIRAQALSEMHFDTRYGVFGENVFSKDLIAALSLVAIFLVVTACVNFINLATALAFDRSKEIGVRKVLGGARGQLFLQFLSETAIITLISILLALALAETFLPSLSSLLGITLRLDLMADPTFLALLAVVFLGVTSLSGLYPAVFLSGFGPLEALRNGLSQRKSGGLSVRRGLVIVQFVIAQVLIVGMLVVVSQFDYLRSASLGFDRDAILLVPIPKDSLSQLKLGTLKSRLLEQPGVGSVSYSFLSAIDNSHWNSDFKYDTSPTPTDFNADLMWADADYFRTYNLQLVAGRQYVESDTVREFVVNESLVHKLGIQNPADILGKKLTFWDGELSAPIVGVVRDFHVAPLRKAITPAVLGCWKGTYGLINMKIRAANASGTLTAVANLWNQTFPNYVYEHQFLDEKIDHFYRHEARLSDLYKIFAGIAVFISCLGLYGLVSFMAVRRTKEIGVRKVLGASVPNILYLLSREFTALIAVAFVVAAPVAYYIMSAWLDNFAYRVQIGTGIFFLVILGTVSLAWVTVGYRAVRAALLDPVEALRYE